MCGCVIIFSMTICRKFVYFPSDRVPLVFRRLLFVQLSASGETARNLRRTRLGGGGWFYLIILHLVSFSSLFPFCCPQFYAYWIWMLLLCSIRGTLNIPAKPLNLRVSMYMDLVRKPLGIKLWRMTQIETLANSHRIRTHTWEHISCSKCPLFLNNEGQRKCVRQRSGSVWLV